MFAEVLEEERFSPSELITDTDSLPREHWAPTHTPTALSWRRHCQAFTAEFLSYELRDIEQNHSHTAHIPQLYRALYFIIELYVIL